MVPYQAQPLDENARDDEYAREAQSPADELIRRMEFLLQLLGEARLSWVRAPVLDLIEMSDVMHVVTPQETIRRDRGEVKAMAQKKLKALVPPDALQWCSPAFVVEIGDPLQELVDYADKERPDLIVLGLPRDKEFSSPFHTGVTCKLVSSAPCPVLTVRDMATN